MIDESSFDRLINVYDRALFVVDFYATGQMEDVGPTAQLQAVAHFDPQRNLPSVPVGIVPVEEGGGFLRGKRTRYRVVAGTELLPNRSDNPDAAGLEAGGVAIDIALAIVRDKPHTARYVARRYTFTPVMKMFSVRFYGTNLARKGEPEKFLHSVIHFDTREPVPAVPLFVDGVRDGSSGYIIGYSGDGRNITWLRSFHNRQEAFDHLTETVHVLGNAMHTVALADQYRRYFDGWGITPDMTARVYLTPEQARQGLEKVLKVIREAPR